MKIKKVILPLIAIVLLLSSCQEENVEYKMLQDEISDLETALSDTATHLVRKIADDVSPYDLVIESYETKYKLMHDGEVLKAKLLDLNGIISDKLYDSAEEEIYSLSGYAEQCASPADIYYAEVMVNQVEEIVTTYAKEESKLTANTENARVLKDEIDSLEGMHTLDNVILQGQYTVLTSLITCHDAYNQWTQTYEEFSADSLLSDSKSDSKTLVQDCFDLTHDYYTAYSTAVNMVTSLDSDFHANTDIFTQIFSSKTTMFEHALSALRAALDY